MHRPLYIMLVYYSMGLCVISEVHYRKGNHSPQPFAFCGGPCLFHVRISGRALSIYFSVHRKQTSLFKVNI